MKILPIVTACLLAINAAFAQPSVTSDVAPDIRPVARDPFLPRARWDFQPGSYLWTRAAMSAVATHAQALTGIVPRDIETWCPGYETASTQDRQAFWVGMMSALSKHESTYNPRAIGGGNRWYGLLQIYPDTARRYGCYAGSGAALQNAANNLNCAARIMAVTVARDQAVALHDGRWRGVAADWGPMTGRAKRNDMAAWTRAQSYCRVPGSIRPIIRPRLFADAPTTTVTLPPD